MIRAAIIAVSLLATSAMVGCDDPAQGPLAKETERQTEEPRNGHEVAQRVSAPEAPDIPDDIPHILVFDERTKLRQRTGKQIVALARLGYREEHYRGWNECLFVCGNRGMAAVREYLPGIPSTDQGWLVSGRMDGFEACKSRLLELSRDVNFLELRRLCKKAYLPLSDPSRLDGHVMPSRKLLRRLDEETESRRSNKVTD